MNHLSQEDIVAAYYGEPGSEEHLQSCPECQAELARVAVVLDRVESPEVPEPPDDYEARVWDRLRWRMRAEAKRRRNTSWMKWSAVAAVTLLAFITGLFWRRQAAPIQEATNRTTTTINSTTKSAQNTTNGTQAQRDRVLLVVVNDHFDRSERVLVELTNITPNNDNVDIGAERAVAEELLASNRLYRRTAVDRGEDSVATLLEELEPVLLQIAHAPDAMSGDELRRIQKRVEAKGLVFKLRVLRNDVRTGSAPTPQPIPNV